MALDPYAAIERYDGAVVQRGRREALVPCILQPRDVEVIAAVQRHKFLTAPQMRELWWPGGAAEVGRRRLRKLWAAGHLDRFRPVAARGSFPWTYQLGREGHQLLQSVELLPAGQRFEKRQVYDYRYVLHEIRLNWWVIAWRRLLPAPPVAWHGETQIDAPAALRARQLRLGDNLSVEGLKDPKAKQLRPDDVLELTRRDGTGTRTFLIEYDRTRRVDKNFEKFRRYDTFLCWWWRHTEYGDVDQLPWVLFVCQDEEQRTIFLERADRELTGHLWSPSRPPADHEFVGRERILFASERDMHHGQAVAYRVPQFPPGHSARTEHNPGARLIRLPGAARGDDRAAA